MTEALTGTSRRIYELPKELLIEHCDGKVPKTVPLAVRAIHELMADNNEYWQTDSRRKSALSMLRNAFKEIHGAEFAQEVFEYIRTEWYASPKIEQPYRELRDHEMQAIDSLDTRVFANHRARTAIELMKEAALRPREIARLTPRDFNLEEDIITATNRAKANGEWQDLQRDLPVSEECMNNMRKYWTHAIEYMHGKEVEGTPFLFTLTAPLRAMQPAGITQTVKQALQSVGVDIAPRHLTDHCMAQLAKAGYSKRDMKKFRGVQGLFRAPQAV